MHSVMAPASGFNLVGGGGEASPPNTPASPPQNSRDYLKSLAKTQL